jgi:hypothetical protein
MMDFYILWTYSANYSDRPIKIRAHNAQEAVKSFAKFYSKDFQDKATVYAFTEPPVGIWKNGGTSSDNDSGF